MSNYQTPLRDINFTLFELLDYSGHCVSIGQSALDVELANAFLTEAARFSETVLAPLGPMGDIFAQMELLCQIVNTLVALKNRKLGKTI